MASTTTAQTSTTREIPLSSGELAIVLSSEAIDVAPSFVVTGARAGCLSSNFEAAVRALPSIAGAALGAWAAGAGAGRILKGSGPHAVSAGTSSSAARVT